MTNMTKSSIYEMMKKYQKEDIVCCSAHITMEENIKGEFKKQSRWIKGYAEFNLKTKLKERYVEEFNSIAIRCGEISGIFCVDVDNMDAWKVYLKERNQKQPITITAKTAKGVHLYFKYDSKLANIVSNTNLYNCFDIRSNNSVLFAPGSSYIHKSRNSDGVIVEQQFEYTWKYGESVFDFEMAELPEWLYSDIVGWKKDVTKDVTKTVPKFSTNAPKKCGCKYPISSIKIGHL